MPAGIQLYNDAGKLLYDSNVHKVLRLFKTVTMLGSGWTSSASNSVTFPVVGVSPTKHIVLPFGDSPGSRPMLFVPVVETNMLRIFYGNAYALSAQIRYTVYIMEYA